MAEGPDHTVAATGHGALNLGEVDDAEAQSARGEANWIAMSSVTVGARTIDVSSLIVSVRASNVQPFEPARTAPAVFASEAAEGDHTAAPSGEVEA